MLNLLKRIFHRIAPSRHFHRRAFANARHWSNAQLREISQMFTGDVVNVSAWEDQDKQGERYRSYFTNCNSYHTTNFGTEQGVLQGDANEMFLDLEQDLSADLAGRFDVVFNHTTIEHVWDFHKAMDNICLLSNDIVIIVAPWLQPQHTDYGDFWRFSPLAIAKLLDDRGLKVIRLSWNSQQFSAVYIFAVATRHPDKWLAKIGGALIDIKSPAFLKLPADFPGRRAFG
jgi:hypothetical protein